MIPATCLRSIFSEAKEGISGWGGAFRDSRRLENWGFRDDMTLIGSSSNMKTKNKKNVAVASATLVFETT